MRQPLFSVVLVVLIGAGLAQVRAQAPVTGSADPESLFTSPDPKLHANKQVVLHIVRDLLEANHWDQADKYLTKEYIQHNPNVASGLEPVMKFFGGRKPTPIPDRRSWKTKVVSVTAEGDLRGRRAGARLRRPSHAGQDVHVDLVRHVAHQGREGRRALGRRHDRPAGGACAALTQVDR